MEAHDLKICAMCRNEIDKGAMLCSHCGSGTNYQFFKEFPYDQITRERSKTRAVIAEVLTVGITALVAFYGIMLFSFWVGLGVAAITYKIVVEINKALFRVDGCDKATIECNACSNTESYQWPEGSLDIGKSAWFDCPRCKQRTQVMSGPPVFAPSCPAPVYKPATLDSTTPGIVSDSLDR